MKKLLLICGLIAVTMLGFAQETKRVAILEVVDKEGKLTYSQKLMLRSNLAKAVTNTAGYEAYDRTDIDAILNEQDFQRTGMVSDAQIKKLGEMTGAAYILVAEGVIADAENLFVTAKIMNVETGRIIMTESALVGIAAKLMQRGCSNLAYNLFNNLTSGSGNAAASTSKFLSLFKAKTPDEQKQYEDSVAAAQKAEKAALAAQAKEQQRQESERARMEREAEQSRMKEQQRQDAERARLEREAEQARLQEEQRLAEERRKQEEAERAKYSIARIDGNEYQFKGSTMDKKAYAQFLQTHCPSAFAQYAKGKKLIGAGWGTFAAGMALMAGGAACMILYSQSGGYEGYNPSDYEDPGSGYDPGNEDPDSDPGYDDPGYGYAPRRLPGDGSSSSILFPLSVAALSIGGTAVVVSIPLLGIGYSKCNNAYKVFNADCASPSINPLSLNVVTGKNSIGIALNF